MRYKDELLRILLLLALLLLAYGSGYMQGYNQPRKLNFTNPMPIELVGKGFTMRATILSDDTLFPLPEEE